MNVIFDEANQFSFFTYMFATQLFQPSSGPHVFLLSLLQARPGTQLYDWELGRLGSLALVGSQSRRQKTLTLKHPLVGVSGETMVMGVNPGIKSGVEP